MIFKIPIFLVIILIISFLIKLIIKNGDTGFDSFVSKFLKKERNANMTFKKFQDLNLPFVFSNKENLPFKNHEKNLNYKKLEEKQKIVERKMSLKMIKFDEDLSNTQIKEAYGANNFEKIMLYEEHFNGYVLALISWAEELIKNELFFDAEIVLKEALNIKANNSKIYILLADIYYNSDAKKLLELKKVVNDTNVSLKEKVLNYIDLKLKIRRD